MSTSASGPPGPMRTAVADMYILSGAPAESKDALVYEPYRVTEEEIKIVESGA